MTQRLRDRRHGLVGLRLLGYVGLAAFLALEATTRQPGAASRLDPTTDDDGTTRRIARAYLVAGIADPIVQRLPVPASLPRVFGLAGLALEATGLALRAWSMRVLGGAYTRTLRTDAEQRVVDDGPYRVIRHPGYLGSLLTWVGFALTSRNGVVVAIVGALLDDAYRRRIIAEERLLSRDLPGYDRYASRTWRLLPRIW